MAAQDRNSQHDYSEESYTPPLNRTAAQILSDRQNYAIRNLKGIKVQLTSGLKRGTECEDEYLLQMIGECCDKLIQKIKARQKHTSTPHARLHTYPNSKIVNIT